MLSRLSTSKMVCQAINIISERRLRAKMSMSMFASDFDGNKAGSIEHSKDSAISRRKTENYYNRSKYRSIFFQICQSCFWCASSLYKSRITQRCPSCKSSKVGSLPISSNEISTYHYESYSFIANGLVRQ
jgi:hypothetical protein